MLYLVSSPVSRQYDAMWEVEWALDECRIEKTKFRGLFILETEEDAIAKIADYPTQAVNKVFRVDLMVKTDIATLEEAALGLAEKKIEQDETFSVRCRNRHSDLDSQDVERRLGAAIVRLLGCHVDLENPDKVVRVEIMGGRTGISILGRDDVLRKEVVY